MIFAEQLGLVMPLLVIVLLPFVSFICCAVIANVLTNFQNQA